MKNIEALLEKYFEGETSAEEEKTLRQFFSSREVPEHLRMYTPLFAYFDEEIRKAEGTKVVMPQRRIIFRWVSGIAAAVLVLLGIGQIYFFPGRAYCADNYVVINGRCYTDIHKIREHAFHALQEVSDSDREFFPVMGDDEMMDREIIENQFRELGDFFSDDESETPIQ